MLLSRVMLGLALLLLNLGVTHFLCSRELYRTIPETHARDIVNRMNASPETMYRRLWKELLERKKELLSMTTSIADPVMRVKAEIAVKYLGYDQSLSVKIERLYQQGSPEAKNELSVYLAKKLGRSIRRSPWKGYLALIGNTLDKEASIDLVSRVMLLEDWINSQPVSECVRGEVLDFHDAVEEVVSRRIIPHARLRGLEKLWEQMNNFNKKLSFFSRFSLESPKYIDPVKSWREDMLSEFRDDSTLMKQFFEIRTHNESSRAAFADMLKFVQTAIPGFEMLPESLVPDRGWFVHAVLWRIREAVHFAETFAKVAQKTDAGLDLIEDKLLGPGHLATIASACRDVCSGIYATQRRWAESYGFLKKSEPESSGYVVKNTSIDYWKRRRLIAADNFRERYRGRYFVYANDPDVYWYKFGNADLPEFPACDNVGIMLSMDGGMDGENWMNKPYGKSHDGTESYIEVHYDNKDRFTIHFRSNVISIPYSGYRVTFRYDPKTNSAKTEAIVNKEGKTVTIAYLNSILEEEKQKY